LHEAKPKCIICGERPATLPKCRCSVCHSTIESDRNHAARRKPYRFLTYRGNVVGLFPHGDDGHEFRAEILKRDAEKLPKGRTINLDVYCPGYTREVIKRFKSCVLALSSR